MLGAVLSKGLNGPVIFLSPFSKCSQRGCVNGLIFTFGVAQFSIGHLATIPSRIAPYIQLTLSGAVHASGYNSTGGIVPEDPHLPERSLDLVLIAYAYHEFSQPEEIMAAVRRSLKPGGRVVLLEYALETAYTSVPGLHKMRLEDIRSEIEPMGFALDRMLHLIPKQHCAIFVKWPREQ